MSHTGVIPDNYTGDSLRIGCTMLAGQLGFTPYEIKDFGKWSSDAYMSLHSNHSKLLSELCYKTIIPDNHKTLIKLIYNIIIGTHNKYYWSLSVPSELMIYLLFYVNCVFLCNYICKQVYLCVWKYDWIQ